MTVDPVPSVSARVGRWRAVGTAVVLGTVPVVAALACVVTWACAALPGPWRWVVGIPAVLAMVPLGGALMTGGELLGRRGADPHRPSLASQLTVAETESVHARPGRPTVFVPTPAGVSLAGASVTDQHRLASEPEGVSVAEVHLATPLPALGGGELAPYLWVASAAWPHGTMPPVAEGEPDLVLWGEDAPTRSGTAVMLTHPLLQEGWWVEPGAADAVRALITERVALALNSSFQPTITIAVSSVAVMAFTDERVALVDPQLLVVGIQGLYAALCDAPGMDLHFASLTYPEEQRAYAAQGRGQSHSLARDESINRGAVGVVTVLALVAMALVGGVQHREWGMQAWWGAAALAVVGVVVAVVDNSLERRQRASAAAVVTLATERGWRFRQRDRVVEQGWSRRPFAGVARLVASPTATGLSAWGTASGVAYLEGDRGRWPVLRAFAARVAWATVPGRLPVVDIVREGPLSTMLTAWAGMDVDVESMEFNSAWRVRAESARVAHALLTPAVVQVLNEVAATDHVAFHLDGDRVVLWDDATREHEDLSARLALVERLAAAVPRFVTQEE